MNIKEIAILGLLAIGMFACGTETKPETTEETGTKPEVVEEKVTVIKEVNTNDKIVWVGRKVGGMHKGTIKVSEREFKFENEQIVGAFTVDMNSIICTDIDDEEKNGKLIGHLKNADFFAVEEFKEAKFVINSSEKMKKEGVYMIKGDLTIKGVLKPIEFPVSITKEGDKLRVKGSFAFDRTEYGITYNSKSILGSVAGKFIYDEIELDFDWLM